MTVQLPKHVEEGLRLLAANQGRSLGEFVEEAVEQYLLAAAITDTSAADVAATQEALLAELGDVPPWTGDRT